VTVRSAFAALIPRTAACPAEIREHFTRTALAHGLSAYGLERGAIVATAGASVVDHRGAVIGTVFDNSGRRPPDPVIREGCRTAGRQATPLPWWGDFVGLVTSIDRTVTIIERAPFSSLSCFWTEKGSYVWASSSPVLLRSLVPSLAIDWRQLAMFLLAPQMRFTSTCLENVNELPAGFALEVGLGNPAVHPRWSPWDHACARTHDATLDDAASVMRAVIDRTVRTTCADAADPVLLLSGGIDSSVLAAALRNAGCSFSAVTMVTRHKSGDERRYARAVAAAMGVRVIECLRSVSDIDWEDATPARLARPSARIFRQPTLAAAQRLAAETGTDTILDGGGGDGLFCSLQSVAPLLDRLAAEGLGSGAWATARETALRTEVSVLAVLLKAIRRKASGRVAYRWPIQSAFLTNDTRSLAPCAARHPWLDPPPGALPGQAAHVALVLDAVGLAEDDSTDPAVRTGSPLVAQPIVEAALRVPSWLWFEAGRNRAVIRRAFADMLPTCVGERSGKGTTTGFMGEIAEQHCERLRALLLDGLLVERGIADPLAVEAALHAPRLAREQNYGELLVLADAERWARLWS